jgi:hypothetical protein
MPKRGVNPKKLAAGAVRNADVLAEALAGKYEVGQVQSVRGFGGFEIKLVGGKRREVAIASKVFKGGKTSPFYVVREDWLIVDGPEVVGVINSRNRDGFAALQRAGRIPADAAFSGLEEVFDLEETEEERAAREAAEATWGTKEAKSKREEAEMASRLEQAAAIAGRIRAARAGLLARSAAAPAVGSSEDDRGLDLMAGVEEDEGMPLEESAAAGGAASDSGARRQITSKRRLAAIAAREAAEALAAETEEDRAARAAYAAAQVELAAEIAREQEEELRAELAVAELEKLRSKIAEAGDWEAFVDAI